MNTVAKGFGARSGTLDVLRGVFIVLMIDSHVGAFTPLTALLHGERYVSAASGFMLLSGWVLGLVSRRRQERGPRAAYGPLLRRVGLLWAVHCALMLGLFCARQLTGDFAAPAVEDVGGWPSALFQIATLRLQSNDYMNVLPLYVVLLLVAVPVLEGFRRGWTPWVMAVSVALYAAAQAWPELLRVAGPRSGPQVFSLAAWQMLFFAGLAVGYHRDALAERAWAAHRRWWVPLCGVVFVGLFALAQAQRPRFEAWHLLSAETEAWWFRRETHAPGMLLFFVARLQLLHVAVEAWRRSGRAVAVWRQLEGLGQHSLLCFVAHLPLALAVQELGGARWSNTWQHLAIAASVVLVALLARAVGAASVRPRVVPVAAVAG